MNRVQVLIVLCSLALVPLAHADTTLVNDTFNRGTTDAPVTLDGKAPTYSLTPETWTAPSEITTNGTSANIPGVSGDQATGYLGIPGAGTGLTVGTSYTLTFTLEPASFSSWTNAGFGTIDDTGAVSYNSTNYGGFWALDNGGGVELYANSSNGSPNPLGGASVSGAANISLTIDVGATTDTLSALINGNPVTLSDSSIELAPIEDIFLGHYEAAGSFENFTLTETPEPGTWALLLSGVGVLFLAVHRRRALA